MIFFFVVRIISRLVVLPFKVPREPHEGISLDEKEQALRAARKNASSSIGHLIKVGKSLISLEGRKKIFEDILPQICGLFGPDNKSTRIEKNYALCIHATVEVMRRSIELNDQPVGHMDFPVPLFKIGIKWCNLNF